MEGTNPTPNTNTNEPQPNNTQNATQGTAEQEQKTFMFVADYTNNTWVLQTTFADYFNNEYNILSMLRELINDKEWSEQQTYIYLTYIDVRLSYINSVYQQQLTYSEDYQAWVNYAIAQYPVGQALYQKQFKYLKSHVDKANRKAGIKNPKAEQPKAKPREQVQQKEKVVVRSGDPEINIQKLMSTDWDPTKYLSASFLAKQNANIVFIGHVDSGKSTLTGNIITQLKEIDQQQLARNKQELKQNKMEAWQDAAVADIIPEERVDGKTREYAKMNFTLSKKRFTLFDAPGHKNYVPNMIMGACQADIAVLIISAKEGEFQSGFQKDGQTKEHAMLAKALGVIELIAVVTKLGTVNWEEKRFNHIKEQVFPFLDKNCGFHNVTFIPIDSIQNKNIHTKIPDCWYKGPCFTEYLDNVTLPERKPMGPLRIPVIDKFKDVGQLYVYGKIESGTIIQDQTVTILPQRQPMVIKEIFNAKDEKMGFALAGENVKMRVKNIEENEINRGDMICNNLNYCQESAELKAKITILELPQEKKLVSSGYQCVIHMHAIAVQVEISKVQARIDKETGKKLIAGFLKTGQKGICQLKLQRPVCLEKYEFMAPLGRFTLRDQGKTIGYGQIMGFKPARKLLEEQKEHLLAEKKQETRTGERKVEEVTKQVEEVSIKETQG